MMPRASGLFAVMISTVAPSATGVSRSAKTPSIFPPRAARARPAPMEAATSATVAPASRVFFDPSGNTISITVPFRRRVQTEHLRHSAQALTTGAIDIAVGFCRPCY